MPTLAKMIFRAGNLRPTDTEFLHRIVGDWQVLADVAFGDLLLLLPLVDNKFLVGAHVRPATASPAFIDDVVGHEIPEHLQPLIVQALESGECVKSGHDSLKFFAAPVCDSSSKRRLAVLLVAQKIYENQEPQPAKISYATITNALLKMVSQGTFPQDGAVTSVGHGTPRVADGIIHLDEEGLIRYISPNAVSAFHRLGANGSLLSSSLAEQITALNPDTIDETLAVVVTGKAPWLSEVSSNGMTVAMRAIPLWDDGKRVGAAVLTRDITEIRRHEADIVSKNATIKEVHHRVKNNLQTVSALLRLQSRRSSSEEVKQTLNEAGRRVATIALVHETISHTVDEHVDFDEVFGQILHMAADVASPGQEVQSRITGTFGKIPGAMATTLAVVLNELVTNAVEHGLADRSGNVWVNVMREGVSLQVEVHDDGVGIAPGRINKGLGTQIVTTMVHSELHGSIEWSNKKDGGTCVTVVGRIDQR